jgi:hypothetical protein
MHLALNGNWMTPQRHTLDIGSGVRPVTETGPRGGERRRFQVFIDRREYKYDEDRPFNGKIYDSSYNTYCGETFARQWEAVQAAHFTREWCGAAEIVFAWLRRSAA